MHATNYAYFQKPLVDSLALYRATPKSDNLLLLIDATNSILKILEQPAKVKFNIIIII